MKIRQISRGQLTRVDQRWLNSKTIQFGSYFSDGSSEYYLISAGTQTSIDHKAFESSEYLSKQLIYVESSGIETLSHALTRVDFINKNIDDYFDETDRGEVFSRRLENICELKAQGRARITISQLAWHPYDAPLGRALIGWKQGKYFPDSLDLYKFEINLTISTKGDLMNFDVRDVGNGETVSLADPLISDKDIAALWDFARFASRGEDNEIDAAVEAFKAKSSLTPEHAAIRMRIQEFL
jgi:hypothetical protein